MQSNEDCLLIDYSPFTQESRVYIYSDGKQQKISVQSDLSGLAEVLVGLAYGNQNFNIKMRAPFAITNEISKQITELEQYLYSDNKITVEGI